MKLVLKDIGPIDDALCEIEYFLSQYRRTYNMVRGNMTLEFNLETLDHKPCMDNLFTYTISPNGLDVDDDDYLSEEERAKIERQKVFTTQGWQNYLNAQRRKFKKEKNQMNSFELRKAEKRMQVLQTLESRFNNGEFTWGYEKEQGDHPIITYEVNFHIFWEDVNGADWYFVAYTGYYGKPYGRLNTGLPAGF